MDSVNGVYAANIAAGPTGAILGEMQVTGGQASWSGLQVDYTTPEPWALASPEIGMAPIAIRRPSRRLRP